LSYGILRTHDEKTDDDPNFLFNIVFSDEATFKLNSSIDITADSGLTTILIEC